MNENSNNASIENKLEIPDYFSCKNCTVGRYGGQLCEQLVAEHRCAKVHLGEAIASGQVTVVLSAYNNEFG
jgi:hypothetical protein